MRENTKKKILLISPEYWGDNFVSKHHYASYLSEKYKVYFLNPPMAWSLKSLFFPKIKLQSIHPDLIIVNTSNLFPRLNYFPKFLQNIIFRLQSKIILKQLNLTLPDILWSFTPMIWWNLDIWHAKKKIYHTVDFHPQAKYEEDTCKSADLIIGVTDLVIEPLKKWVTDIHKISHGLDIHSFEKNDPLKVHLPGKNKIKAGYVGNFHNQVNYDLLYKICVDNPIVDFILVGPYHKSNLSHFNTIIGIDFDKLSALKNVFFTGSIPSTELVNYLIHFDINLVLFKDEKKIIHCNPHKMMGYLYAGGITVSNFLDEFKDKRHLLLMADSENEIPDLFDKAVKNLDQYNHPDKVKERKAFALDNAYPLQIARIEKLINTIH